MGSVMTEDAPLLLGQSFLSKFGSWSMDYNSKALVLIGPQ